MSNGFDNGFSNLFLISQPGAEVAEVYDFSVKLAQTGNVDVLNLLAGERMHSRHEVALNSLQNADRQGMKLKSFGSISSMDIPGGYRPVAYQADTEHLSMDEAPRLFQSEGESASTIGAWHRHLGQSQATENLKEISAGPPHALSDDEYFKISDLMTPGPWAGNGRGHEISMRTDVVNGRNVIVYDYWKGKDQAKDTFESRLGPDDIRCRVVFAPDEKTNRVDILWLQAPNMAFDVKAAQFDRALESIRWH